MTVAAAAGSMAVATGDVVLGSEGHRYRVEVGWAKLPEGKSFVDASAVCVDAKDNVYVFTRSAEPVMVFDRDGNHLRSWGMDIGFVSTHGAYMGLDNHLYLTDHFGHNIRKCTQEGKVVMTIGTPGHGAPRYSGEPFNLCTHTAVSPEGDIYVSDGYCNARVHKYSPKGKYLFSWGESGTGPGEFQVPHNIACDDEGRVYVADRENHRIQVFDKNGKYQTQWNNLGRPCGLHITRGTSPLIVVGELGPHFVNSFSAGARNVGPRVLILNTKGEILSYLGREPLGEGAGQFIAPHGIAVDSRGDIYVAEVSNTLWPQLYGKKADQELRCFQKLVRLD
jgi:DNA-binding beta-propeller fold protein YncE